MSADIPLGLPFNMVQCWTLLCIMAKITGHKPGKVYHKIVNAHIYEDQIEGIEEQLTRQTVNCHPRLILPDVIDIDKVVTDDFKIVDYHHLPSIKFPFSV